MHFTSALGQVATLGLLATTALAAPAPAPHWKGVDTHGHKSPGGGQYNYNTTRPFPHHDNKPEPKKGGSKKNGWKGHHKRGLVDADVNADVDLLDDLTDELGLTKRGLVDADVDADVDVLDDLTDALGLTKRLIDLKVLPDGLDLDGLISELGLKKRGLVDLDVLADVNLEDLVRALGFKKRDLLDVPVNVDVDLLDGLNDALDGLDKRSTIDIPVDVDVDLLDNLDELTDSLRIKKRNVDISKLKFGQLQQLCEGLKQNHTLPQFNLTSTELGQVSEGTITAIENFISKVEAYVQKNGTGFLSNLHLAKRHFELNDFQKNKLESFLQSFKNQHHINATLPQFNCTSKPQLVSEIKNWFAKFEKHE